MDCTADEIKFVAFCADNIDCTEDCPAQGRCQSCEQGNEPCRAIPSKMESGMELSPDDKEIVHYFLSKENESRLWKRGTCIPKGADERCPNGSLCDQREKEGQGYICAELLDKLGFYSTEEQRVLESEIQKIVINSLASINWEVGEEVKYHPGDRSIAVGRPDILLEGKESRTLYVVELKPWLADRGDVGQLQAYVGWYQRNMPAKFKAVKGILLAKELDEGAKYAIGANRDLQARLFDLHAAIRKPE